ncbi:MAG: hypothetical protein ACPGXK_02725 [Phycisphaerae bacterium]
MLNHACIASFCCIFASAAVAQTPLSAVFTYQGRLQDGETPLDGTVDMEFRLFDAVSGGSQIGASQIFTDLLIAGGVITVELDFGVMAFNGDARWLEIAVANPAGGPFVVLTPRQPLAATPYAQTALEAKSIAGIDGHSLNGFNDGPTDALYVDNAGNVGIGRIDPMTALDVNGTVTADSFVGDGSGLSGIAGDDFGTFAAGSGAVALAFDGANIWTANQNGNTVSRIASVK